MIHLVLVTGPLIVLGLTSRLGLLVTNAQYSFLVSVPRMLGLHMDANTLPHSCGLWDWTSDLHECRANTLPNELSSQASAKQSWSGLSTSLKTKCNSKWENHTVPRFPPAITVLLFHEHFKACCYSAHLVGKPDWCPQCWTWVQTQNLISFLVGPAI